MTRINPSGEEWRDQAVRAKRRRAVVLRMITGGPKTILQIVAVTKTATNIARQDVATLIKRGVVHRVIDTENYKLGTTCAVYHLGPGDESLKGKGAQPSRAFVTSWKRNVPPMFEPMAYLFGRVVPEAVC